MYKAGAFKAGTARAAELPTVMQARKLRPRDPHSSLLPAGQTTQMVIGASPESDRDILVLAENLYLAYDVRRVYYSAYVPAGADPRVPALAGPPLLREHRLYQADWLFRFYGFAASEVLDGGGPNLDTELDPKCAWALRNLQRFPVDVNKAEYLELLRVPGIGPKSAMRIVRARRQAPLTVDSLGRIGVVMKRARWFLCCSGVPAFDTPARGSSMRAASIDNPAGLRALLSDGAQGEFKTLQREFSF
jgi:predicted DNA-binding helix-hairpin-helix protein